MQNAIAFAKIFLLGRKEFFRKNRTFETVLCRNMHFLLRCRYIITIEITEEIRENTPCVFDIWEEG